MPWVDEIVCLECGKSIEITNGQLPPNACVPEPGDPQPEGPCALVMAKVWEPEMVAGTAAVERVIDIGPWYLLEPSAALEPRELPGNRANGQHVRRLLDHDTHFARSAPSAPTIAPAAAACLGTGSITRDTARTPKRATTRTISRTAGTAVTPCHPATTTIGHQNLPFR